MSSRFQTAVLGSSLVYPNAVVWSEENLVAVACGSIVVILNPGNPGVRGLVTVPSSKPFPLGVVDGEGEDLLSGCLLPCHLSRDTRPCVRSISWSPVGLSNNAGCLIAVCTVAGRVKLYRFPFFEFSAEWIEVVDISEMLYNYFTETNFEDYENNSAGTQELIFSGNSEDHECATGQPVSDLRKDRKQRRKNTRSVVAKDSDKLTGSKSWEIVPLSACKRLQKSREKKIDDHNLPLITVQQYATRNAMLASLTVAWSPIMGTSGGIPHSSSSCSILAVGGKCGRVSLWRVRAPECYSIVKCSHSSNVTLVSFLKAHDAWVTVIDWAIYGYDTSTTHLVLATGSSDGRVKIWQVNTEELLKSSDVTHASFSLLKEIVTGNSAIVSVLSLSVPSNFPWKIHVAIGEGTGSFEVWILDMLSKNLENVGCYNAHNRIVTGLVWTFDGSCLYSCSLDNSMKCWILVGDSMHEVPIPSNTLGSKSSSSVSSVFDSCYGVAASPGNLAVAMARGFDADLLDPMYEGRTHRAALEFLCIGGQQMDLSSNHPALNNEGFSGLWEKELTWWKHNILWSLSRYERFSRVLNVWDIVTDLCALKQSEPKYVERVLQEWLTSFFKSHIDISCTLSSKTFKFLPNLSSRQLHLINIITRHVVLRGYKEDDTYINLWTKEKINLWLKLLSSSESELLERLVCLSFSATLHRLSDLSTDLSEVTFWYFCGLAQMEQWVSAQGNNIKDQTKSLAAEFKKVDKRKLEDTWEYEANEQCNFCSAHVPFESAEYATCSGVNNDNGVSQRHKLERCATTMRVLPIKPSWYCICCKRWSAHLAPSILFEMPRYPSDFKCFLDSSAYTNFSLPCCPFCGILLQRSQPGYSLSPSPV